MKNGELRVVWEYDYLDNVGLTASDLIRIAINMSKNNTTAKIVEKHGSRWYTLAECKEGELAPKGKAKDYYLVCPDDGRIDVVHLYKIEALWRKENSFDLFENYTGAKYRSAVYKMIEQQKEEEK